MPKQQVAVAMSGGVDSSIAAFLLKEAGYEVSGVHMHLSAEQENNISDLRRTCELLTIPLYEVNFETDFHNTVVDYFCREYSLGRTPNPCVVCNRFIKFGLLLDKVFQMGADYLATGHYAKVEPSSDGYRLLKAVDHNKDQSYFLYMLGQRELQHLLLPLGSHWKSEVKKLAAQLGLPAVNHHDSQDVCFVPDNDYRSFIAKRVHFEPGDIVDTSDNVLGRHDGLARYTVGQRHGIGLSPKKPFYVIRLDASQNRLVVGSEEQLLSDRLLADNLNWVSGETHPEPVTVTTKIRYRSPEISATLCVNGRMAEVNFCQPQRAIAPGQAIVFYQDNAVLGGGVIENVK